MQELFAKEIPVAFAIDWKQSSDGNLSDAIQEKVESSGKNLPRFSCSSTASFLSQQGREESGHLQWFCMSVCLSKLIHDGEAAWESSLSEVKFVAFAGPVCSPISHRWVWSEWRASNSSLCHCYRSVSKGAANGHVLLLPVEYWMGPFSLDLPTHQMFLRILLARHAASQVLRSIPQTPPNPLTPPSSPHTINSSPTSLVQSPEDVSPFSFLYSPG